MRDALNIRRYSSSKSALCARYGLLYSNTDATVHSVAGLYVVLIRSSPGNHRFKPLATYEPRSHVGFASLRAPATYTFQAPYIRCTGTLPGRSSSYKRSGLRQAEPTKNVAGFEHIDPNSLLWNTSQKTRAVGVLYVPRIVSLAKLVVHLQPIQTVALDPKSPMTERHQASDLDTRSVCLPVFVQRLPRCKWTVRKSLTNHLATFEVPRRASTPKCIASSSCQIMGYSCFPAQPSLSR